MAAGQIEQFYGPFGNETIFNNKICYLGISVDQKDCMEWQNGEDLFNDKRQNKKPIIIQLSNQTTQKTIQLGRTFIYQPGDVVSNISLSFYNGAPPSTKVDVIYLN